MIKILVYHLCVNFSFVIKLNLVSNTQNQFWNKIPRVCFIRNFGQQLYNVSILIYSRSSSLSKNLESNIPILISSSWLLIYSQQLDDPKEQ